MPNVDSVPGSCIGEDISSLIYGHVMILLSMVLIIISKLVSDNTIFIKGLLG
jgi:hypothetical protein